MRCHFVSFRFRVLVAGLAVCLLPLSVYVAEAQQDRASRMRNMAARFLGGTSDVIEDLMPGEDVDAALLDPVGGGMRDLEQSLGEAVFAVPVAGNIGYVLRPQLYHDLPIVFPPHWTLVSVLLADETRWRYARHQSMILVQPGEVGARTNMTLVFQTGELLQLDLEEVTGAFGRARTGRVYIGPEGWLVERVFALMPSGVQERVVAVIRDGTVKVSELLADPIAVIRAHGAFDALPPAQDDRWARLRAQAEEAVDHLRAAAPPAPPVVEPEPQPEPEPEPPVRPDPPPDARIIPMPSFGSGPDSDGDPSVPEDSLRRGLPPRPRVPPPRPPFNPVPPLVQEGPPMVPRGGSPDVIAPQDDEGLLPVVPPADGVGPMPSFPQPSADLGASLVQPAWALQGVRLMDAGLLAGDTLPPDFRLAGADPPPAAGGQGPPLRRRDLPDVPPPPRFVSAEAVQAVERELAAAQQNLDLARRSAGDRIAERTLEIDRNLEDLREHYPSRVHFSLVLDPDTPPYTAPFWHLGAWHDHDFTYWRLLAPRVSFIDMSTGTPVQAERLDDYLYRLPGLIEHGAVVVLDSSERPVHLFWRRRRELEGP